jgi:hypothetical protein
VAADGEGLREKHPYTGSSVGQSSKRLTDSSITEPVDFCPTETQPSVGFSMPEPV